MKTHTRFGSIPNLLAGAALAIGLSGAALAAPGGGMPEGMGHGGGFGVVQVLQSLKSDLKLTDSQQALWDAAVAKSKTVKDRVTTQRTAGLAALKAALDSGNPDFRALAATRDANADSNKPFMQDAQNAWLTVYDKLDATQRKLIVDRMKKGLEFAAKFPHGHGK